MRKTIYVSSQKEWDEVVLKSKSIGLSISQYLLGGKHVGNSQLDRIEAMLNRLVPEKRGTPIYGNGVSSNKITLEDHGLSDPNVFEPETEDAELKAANERLLKNRLEIAKLKAKGLQTGNEVPFRSMPKGGK